MKAAVIDVWGPYGHFRKPYAPMSPVTYPFPPPPTILGLAGAICGYSKEEYLSKTGWNTCKIAISIVNPVKKYRTGINLINTKGNKLFRLTGDAPRIQIPYEFLKNPKYRIYLSNLNDEFRKDLERYFETGVTVFTPSLGLAQCISQVEPVGFYDVESLSEDIYEISSVIPYPQDHQINYEIGRRYGRIRVPGQMAPGREVKQYTEVLCAEDAKPIQVKTKTAYKINEENIFFF